MAIVAARVAAVLLAAGQSRRFGAADKLAAPLAGRALGGFAADTLRAIGFAARFVVVGPAGAGFDTGGFTEVVNPDPGHGQASSLARGVAAAHACGADSCLVVLADMPLVTAGHLAAMLARYGPQADIVASVAPGGRAMVPALFAAAHFPALMALRGDSGAKSLLAGAALVGCPMKMLADIDDRQALAEIERSIGSG